MLVVRPLHELVELAAGGKFVVFTDPVSERRHAGWAELVGRPLPEPIPYTNAGIIFLPGMRGEEIVRRVYELGRRIDLHRTQHGAGTPDDPYYYYDQDVFNALLATEVESSEREILPGRLSPHPPFAGLELVDERRLECRYPDGSRPYVLHHVLAKPWLERTRWNLYTALLRRVLTGSDVPLRLLDRELPPRLRRGARSEADRLLSDLVALGRAQRGRLGLRRRLRARRQGRNTH